MLRTGPYGDGFGADPEGLTLAVLEAHPHGIDFGPLQPRIPEALRTPTGRIELAPQICLDDVARLRAALDAPRPDLVLVGRRDLRSNNSWMHNLPVLVKGKDRCTLQVHPDDAAHAGVVDGAPVRVRSAAGEVVVPVEITDAVRPGVVSLPHGWGHDRPGTRMNVAAARGGCQQQRARAQRPLRPALGQRGAQRHPRRARTRLTAELAWLTLPAAAPDTPVRRVSRLRRAGPW